MEIRIGDPGARPQRFVHPSRNETSAGCLVRRWRFHTGISLTRPAAGRRVVANATANMQTTWILVADGARARILASGPDGDLVELQCFSNPEGRAHGRDLATEGPPTVHESVGASRHSIEPHTTAREKAADRFARQLGEALHRARNDHAFERLVIVAPARFLGFLHRTLDPSVRSCIVNELHLDLTRLTPAELRSRLRAAPARAPGDAAA